MKTAPFLLVDVSNSFTKLALTDGVSLLRRWKAPTPELAASPAARREALFGRGAWSRCVLSSVVPKAASAIKATLRGEGMPAPLVVSHKCRLGVSVDYPQPEKIGADRLANAAAAAALHGCPSVVIDFGTAVTFDIIDAARQYIGGVIAPGLEVMTRYLHERTALLPLIHLEEPPGIIGKSTRDAMLAGAVHGYRGLVREIISEIRADPRIGPDAPVIATGGYAALIAAKLPVISTVDPDLTLHGVRIIGNLNPRIPARQRRPAQTPAASAPRPSGPASRRGRSK